MKEDILHAIETGDIDTLDRMKSEREDFPDGISDELDAPWKEIFAERCCVETAEWLFRNTEARLSGYQPREGTVDAPLIYTILLREDEGRYDVLRAFIKAGADPNARAICDWTPSHVAALRNDLKALRILMDHGADYTLRTRIDHELTPLEEACEIVGENDCTRFLRGLSDRGGGI